MPIFDSFFNELQRNLFKQAEEAKQKKVDYADKLERATDGKDIFKFFLLINVSAIETYVTQTRLQAQLSFRLCKHVALASFVLLFIGVGLGILGPLIGKDLSAAKLVSLAGVLSQFISGVFFYLYNRTLQQFNLLSDKLSAAQEIAISLLANSSISDQTKRDDCSVSLVKLLLSKGEANASASATQK